MRNNRMAATQAALLEEHIVTVDSCASVLVYQAKRGQELIQRHEGVKAAIRYEAIHLALFVLNNTGVVHISAVGAVLSDKQGNLLVVVRFDDASGITNFHGVVLLGENLDSGRTNQTRSASGNHHLIRREASPC